MLFNDHKEFATVCPGQPMDDVAPPEGLSPPTPLPIGAEPTEGPIPRIAYAFASALALAREHYDVASKLSEADGRNEPRDQRLMARSMCRHAGVDPDLMVIAPGQLPKMPKGALVIEHHLLKTVPYWCLFLSDAREFLAAADAARDGKELPHELP